MKTVLFTLTELCSDRRFRLSKHAEWKPLGDRPDVNNVPDAGLKFCECMNMGRLLVYQCCADFLSITDFSAHPSSIGHQSTCCLGSSQRTDSIK